MAMTMEVDLSPAALVAAAHRRTGLDDFGDETLLDRLAAQVSAVDADTGLSGLGRFLVRRRLVGILAARLRLEDFVKRHPEALEVELEPPIIVVGLPRSGTTHLVNLLATDTRFRSLPWWEVIEPIPVRGDGPGRDGLDPRYVRCEAEYLAAKEVSPLTALMHDRLPSSIEEECELLDLDLCTYVLEWLARVPSWRDHAEQLDQFAHYAFLRRELQVLSYLRGPNRWVLKCPQHLERLGPLMATFPDATVAFTLRDPVAVLQSAITMLAYGDRNRRVTIDADQLAGVLGRSHRAPAARRGARHAPDPRGAARRRRVPRVHGRRRGHGHAGARDRRDDGGTTTCGAASTPTSRPTRAARTGAWCTTSASTSGSTLLSCTSGTRSTSTRSPDPHGGALMAGIHRTAARRRRTCRRPRRARRRSR
jgi:hypothetical protein